MLVVGAHRILVDSLAVALGTLSDLVVVGAVGTAADAVEATVQQRPDVVLVGDRLDDVRGPDLARRLIDASPGVAVLVFSADSSPDSVRSAIEAGCLGLLRHDEAFDDVVLAIRSVASGAPRYPGEMLSTVVDLVRSPERHSTATLTPRELDVLRLLALGRSTDEIAEVLVVSRHTVRGYTQRLLTRLGAHSKLEAVVVGLRRRIITIDDLEDSQA